MISTALALLALLSLPPGLAAQFCIDLNTATAQDLGVIIHLGPERAAQVVALRRERPFASVGELARVSGIGPGRVADITKQGLACVAATRATSTPRPAPVPPPRPGQTAAADPERICVVARVVDGDTLNCTDRRRIRLLLIDAPEMTQGLFGSVAKRTLEDFAPPGTRLTLEFDVQRRDPYDRVLAYLTLADGRMVNEELLRAGVAVVTVYPPNVRHVDRFRRAAAAAREAGVGLRAVSAFECLPADYRAGRCAR